MVLLLFGDDLRDGGNGSFVFPGEDSQLVLQMPKNNAFNGYGCCSDRPATEQGSDDPESEPADGAQPVAAASWQASALELGEEDGSVLLFVGPELGELRDKCPRG